MKRFLFLDIDGVVNTVMIYSKPIEGRRMINKDGFYFELCYPNDGRVSIEFAVNWLNKLCLEYNLDIVITSTWLIGHKLQEIANCLHNSGLDTRIKIVDGAFHNQFKGRGVQIESWLENNNYKPDENILIILDDDRDMVGFRKDYTQYLIHCNTFVGFGMNEYSKACEFLDKQIEEKENRHGQKKE